MTVQLTSDGWLLGTVLTPWTTKSDVVKATENIVVDGSTTPVNTLGGDDKILGQGSTLGLQNQGKIDTGSGTDEISINASLYGILNIGSTINTGDGDDKISG
jgi:hypothetical protein